MNPHIQTLDAEVAVNGKQLLGGENGNNGGNVFDLVRDLVYAPQAWQTAEALVKTEAYHVNMALHPDDWFTWRSGIKAPCYCDCRHLNAHAEARVQITEALTEAVRHTFPNASLVVGMAAAGISWGAWGCRQPAPAVGLRPQQRQKSRGWRHGGMFAAGRREGGAD